MFQVIIRSATLQEGSWQPRVKVNVVYGVSILLHLCLTIDL